MDDRFEPSLSEPLRRALMSACKYRREGVPLYGIPRRLIEEAELAESPSFVESFYRLGHAGAWRDEIAALRHIWGSETGDEALAAALYALLRYPDPERAAVCVRRFGKWADRAAVMIHVLMS